MSPPRREEAPLFTQALLGIRTWKVEARLPSSLSRLCAETAEASWEPGGAWTEASCAPPWDGPGRHDAPEKHCTCGLYALHPEAVEVRSQWAVQVDTDAIDDPHFVELMGVIGVVEAAGRIEVHDIGFRAERARPLALIVGREWPQEPRRAVAELAEIYGARVLEVGSVAELLEWCRERGGALGTERVRELLRDAEGLEAVQGPTAPVARGAPPPGEPAWRRGLSWAGEMAVMAVAGVVAVLWYGGIGLIAVMAIGGALFGWFGEEPKPPAARVTGVNVDRERCRVRATVVARRPVKEVQIRVAGRMASGKGLGHFQRRIGPLRRGRATVKAVSLSRALCRAKQPFSLRVRLVWPGGLGAAVKARSRPLTGERQESPPAATRP